MEGRKKKERKRRAEEKALGEGWGVTKACRGGVRSSFGVPWSAGSECLRDRDSGSVGSFRTATRRRVQSAGLRAGSRRHPDRAGSLTLCPGSSH